MHEGKQIEIEERRSEDLRVVEGTSNDHTCDLHVMYYSRLIYYGCEGPARSAGCRIAVRTPVGMIRKAALWVFFRPLKGAREAATVLSVSCSPHNRFCFESHACGCR